MTNNNQLKLLVYLYYFESIAGTKAATTTNTTK